MHAEQRRNLILDILKNKKFISVNELSKALNVSKTTIRSDLHFLESQKLIERYHGGAKIIQPHQDLPIEKSFLLRERENSEKKREIAKKAISLINENDTIILDSSSTCFELAKLLKESKKRLTVLTNGLKTADLLRENLNITVVIIGGIIKNNSNAIESLLGAEMLSKFNIDKFFVSAYGVSLENGFSDFNLYEIELKKLMLNISRKNIALIDSTKFNRSSSLSFAKLTDVAAIVTDKNLKKSILKEYNKKVEIIS